MNGMWFPGSSLRRDGARGAQLVVNWVDIDWVAESEEVAPKRTAILLPSSGWTSPLMSLPL